MTDFKTRLQETDDCLSMHILTIPSAVVAQAVAAAGADSVIIDMEHGAIDHGSAHAMIAATKGTACAPLVRVAENDAAQVKRMLDIGAAGIVFPLIRSAADAERAVASLRYPPRGNRGFGPFIAQSRWDASLPTYRDRMEENLVCCLLVETRDAVENIDAICAVPGIDLLVPAVFDLSTDLGVMGQLDHPELLAAMARVEAAARSASLPLGNAALTQEQTTRLKERGYRVFAGFDVLWLREKTAEAQGWITG